MFVDSWYTGNSNLNCLTTDSKFVLELNRSSSDNQLSSNGERLGYVVSENMNIHGLYFAHILASLRDNPQFCSIAIYLQTSNILHP